MNVSAQRKGILRVLIPIGFVEFLAYFEKNLKGFKFIITKYATKYYRLNVPKHRLYRANKKARVKFDEMYEEQYARI